MQKEMDFTISELEQYAKNILEEKKLVIPRRPIVIEFCGAPKSGKTSCINSLDLFLRRNGFRTKVLIERASVCPVKNKYDPYFNLWTVSSAVAEISEILANSSKKYDVVILDRGIFDALCWFTWLLDRENLDEPNYTSIVAFLTMNKWRMAIDLIYVFTVKPEVSLEREYTGLLTRKMGSIMHPDILDSYNDSINKAKSKFKQYYKRIVKKDTSHKGLNSVNYEVTKDILDILNEITSERIAYFPKALLDGIATTYFSSKCLENRNIILSYNTRASVEKNTNFIQPIPIVVITDKEHQNILVVKKNGKQTDKLSPESNKLLLYFGGHVREEDELESSSKDWLSISRYALHREVKEEINYDYYANDNEVPLCIWDKSNSRSAKHIALCHVKEVNFHTFKPKLDKNEFITQGNTKSGKVVAIKDLLEDFNSLESWSRIILKEVFNLSGSYLEQRDIFNRLS